MRKTLWTLTIILSLFTMFSAYGQTATKPRELFRYIVSLPEGYKNHRDSAYPLMIYLHGASHAGTDLKKLNEWGPPKLISKGKKFKFIVVCPQCPETTRWSAVNWFEPLMEELKKKYRIDPEGVYVTGISMGGFGTWQVAMDFPKKIKGIVPLCGSCSDSLEICRIKNIPVWAIHGVNDGLVKVIHTDRLVNRLKACQGNVKYSRLENRHHGIWNLYDNDDIYNWFFELYTKKKSIKPPANNSFHN